MLAEKLSRGPGEVRGPSERKAGGPQATMEFRQESRSPTDFDPPLPVLNDLMQSVARTLRDFEAMHYAIVSLMPEAERALAVRLIQKRYRMTARHARRILRVTPPTGGVGGPPAEVGGSRPSRKGT